MYIILNRILLLPLPHLEVHRPDRQLQPFQVKLLLLGHRLHQDQLLPSLLLSALLAQFLRLLELLKLFGLCCQHYLASSKDQALVPLLVLLLVSQMVESSLPLPLLSSLAFPSLSLSYLPSGLFLLIQGFRFLSQQQQEQFRPLVPHL